MKTDSPAHPALLQESRSWSRSASVWCHSEPVWNHPAPVHRPAGPAPARRAYRWLPPALAGAVDLFLQAGSAACWFRWIPERE